MVKTLLSPPVGSVARPWPALSRKLQQPDSPRTLVRVAPDDAGDSQAVVVLLKLPYLPPLGDFAARELRRPVQQGELGSGEIPLAGVGQPPTAPGNRPSPTTLRPASRKTRSSNSLSNTRVCLGTEEGIPPGTEGCSHTARESDDSFRQCLSGIYDGHRDVAVLQD